MSDEQPELSIEEELALAFAKHRTGGDVYMDGSHNPLPTERRDAADFIKYHVAPIQDALRGAAIELQLFHDLGTIAAAERDARSALNDTLIGIINDLTAERDALQALVNDLHAVPLDLIEGQWYIEASNDLLDRLDAAAKETT